MLLGSGSLLRLPDLDLGYKSRLPEIMKMDVDFVVKKMKQTTDTFSVKAKTKETTIVTVRTVRSKTEELLGTEVRFR